jgi:hypothetical protein
MAILIAACGTDYTITTRINPDGSCEREMVARIDSSDLEEDIFIIPIDSSWTRNTKMEHDSTKNKTIAIVTVSKKYASVKDMNMEFHQTDENTERPNAKVYLKKKFRWFHTKYRYEETYVQQFPFRSFPVYNYLSEEELQVLIFEDEESDSIYFIGKDSTERKQIKEELDNKFNDYIADNIIEEFYQELILISEKTNVEFFRTLDLPQEKEKIFRELKTCSTCFDDGGDDASVDTLLKLLDSKYGTRAFSALINNDSLAFETYCKKMKTDCYDNLIDDFEHNLDLPGTLLNTNAPKLIDGKPNWKFEGGVFIFADYNMWAESKKTNRWAFIVTIIIIILSFSMLLFRRRKK